MLVQVLAVTIVFAANIPAVFAQSYYIASCLDIVTASTGTIYTCFVIIKAIE